MFFTLILPPIIFGAGYNLRRKFFFKYVFYILLFGVIGTIVNFALVAPLTMLVNGTAGFKISNHANIFNKEGKEIQKEKSHGDSHHRRLEELVHLTSENATTSQESETHHNSASTDIKSKDSIPHDFVGSYIHFSTKEIMLFASVISATDAVAALAFIKEESDPKLFPILFGEGVVNDAVCIVLYQIIKSFLDKGDSKFEKINYIDFSIKTPFKMTEQFLTLFFLSLIVAICVGFGSAYFLKRLKVLKLNRVQEVSLVVFFAFITYSFTEIIGLSPIVSLLFTGVFMAQYTFYNLSFQAREESSVVTKMLSTTAEGFVFVYMGLTVFYYFSKAFSMSFFLWEFFILLLSRIIMVFGSCFVLE